MKRLLSSGILLLTIVSIIAQWTGTSEATATLIREKLIVAQSTHEHGKAKEIELKMLIDKGNQAFTLAQYSDAIEYYKRAIALDPTIAEVHYNLGMTYANMGMAEEAIAEYNKALVITPNDPEIHNNLGAVYLNKGMLGEAITECQKAITLNPELPAAHYNLGIINDRKGQKTLAADYFYTAGVIYLKEGDRKWALKAHKALKATHATPLEKALLEKLNADATLKK